MSDPNNSAPNDSPLYDSIVPETAPVEVSSDSPFETTYETTASYSEPDASDSTGTPDARETASKVADGAKDAAGQVTDSVKSNVSDVASEVKSQASDLFEQTKSELHEQAGTQQKRVASGLRSMSDELGQMASSSEDGGVASDLVRQASTRVESIASWLDGRDPGSLLDEVKGYARRKPGTFVAIAAVAGVLAGRLTRSAVSTASDSSDSAPATPSHESYGTQTVDTQASNTQGFEAPDVESYSAEPAGEFGLGAAQAAPATSETSYATDEDFGDPTVTRTDGSGL